MTKQPSPLIFLRAEDGPATIRACEQVLPDGSECFAGCLGCKWLDYNADWCPRHPPEHTCEGAVQLGNGDLDLLSDFGSARTAS